ncbi:MAG: ABC transporter substrate-binding protein [Candidatus Thorarchaeota archaeon]
MNQRKFKTLVFTVIVLSIFAVSSFGLKPQATQAVAPFFTLVGKTGDPVWADYMNFISQHLGKIGINLDVVILDWPSFVAELIAVRNFDLCIVGLSGGGVDPDFTGVYDENGSLNLFGYHTSMDWNETLGTGTNEWYMREGTLIMPPDGEDRIHHYWAWEQYMMDKICPLKPLFSPRAYVAQWSNLDGYNYTIGLQQSWGKMSFDGYHTGQLTDNELVVNDVAWSDLNPLFSDDAASSTIYGYTMDPLIYYDADLTTWPHLATDWYLMNNTHLRVELRENVKWQTDPDGLYPSEYFDVDDVYFTYYAWKHVSNDQHLFDWIKEMVKVDDHTFDIYIDGDPSTPENEQYAAYISYLSYNILPEHYLNQTQLADGVTPDITHTSWNTFATNCFGTGIMTLGTFTEGVETQLDLWDDCWLLDTTTLTADPDLDYVNRFGDTWDINRLRIRIIPDVQTALLEFEAGKLDIVGCTTYPTKRDEYEADPDKIVQNTLRYYYSFVGFNMREVRPQTGNRDPCESDPTISKGLAVRKAISYAIDRNEINNVIHRGEYQVADHPIYLKMGIWCNPNIIRYDHDVDLARQYMELAGYIISTQDTPGFTAFVALASFCAIASASVLIVKRKK